MGYIRIYSIVYIKGMDDNIHFLKRITEKYCKATLNYFLDKNQDAMFELATPCKVTH